MSLFQQLYTVCRKCVLVIPHFVILHLFSLHFCIKEWWNSLTKEKYIFFSITKIKRWNLYYQLCIKLIANTVFQVDVNPSAAFRQLTAECVRSAKNLQHQHECFHVQFQISTTCPGSIYNRTINRHFICKESFCVLYLSVWQKNTQKKPDSIRCHKHENGCCLGLLIISHLLF